MPYQVFQEPYQVFQEYQVSLCLGFGCLSNTTYNFFAAIVNNGIEEKVEPHLHKTQYGFRAGHSTSEALDITRRMQHFYETHGDHFVMLFSDWENIR